jgi:hypothetical protein
MSEPATEPGSEPDARTVRYFAYGNNMSPEVLAHDVPDSKLLGPARLDGYRLAFTRRSRTWSAGAADVVAADGMCAWGALYELSSDVLDSTLDKKEGADWAYRRERVRVVCGGREFDAYAYVVVEKQGAELPPSPAYLESIVSGARACGIKESYVLFLQSLAGEPDDAFRRGLIVRPTETRVESKGMGLVKLAPAVAARERLRHLVVVRAGRNACVGKLIVDEGVQEGSIQVDQNIRHALGMYGYEMYGTTVSVHSVLGRGRRLGLPLVNPRSLFLRLHRPRWMDSEKGVAVVHPSNMRLLGLSEGEYAAVSYAVPNGDGRYRIASASFRVFGGAADEQERDGKTLPYPQSDEIYLDADARAALGVPSDQIGVPVAVTPDLRKLFLSRLLFYGATVFLAVVALLPVAQELLRDSIAILVTAALSLALTAVFALFDLRGRVRY